MSHDIFQINPVAAVDAATALGGLVPVSADGAERIRGAERSGFQLDAVGVSATVLLDEIVEELGALRTILVTRAELARLADQAGGLASIDPSDLSALLARIDLASMGLAASLDDEVGTGAVAFAPEQEWTPTEIRRWWLGLTAEEQAQLRVTMSPTVGNLNGIPLADRAVANRVTMQQLLDAQDRGGDHDPRLDQFVDELTGLIDPARQIVLFDPWSDGFAAELFGDLDLATSVAVVVPGMGSDLGNFSSRVAYDARRLFGNHLDTAVIAWTGYDAPDGLPALSSIEVMTDGKARTGGVQLAGFLGAVGLETSSLTTVIGHSYGSLTVGHAIRNGMTADRVVFIGSPGVGVDHVRDFPDGAVGEYYAAEVHGDPVAALERFGDSPTDPDFGATVYDAGNADSLSPLGRHSEYFDDGTAVSNLRTIVSGGQPSGDRSAVIDYVVEPFEDVHDGFNEVADFLDGLPGPNPLPLPGRDLGNAAINTAQTGVEIAGVYVEDTVVATAGAAVEGAQWVGGEFVSGVERVGRLPGEIADRLTPGLPSWLD